MRVRWGRVPLAPGGRERGGGRHRGAGQPLGSGGVCGWVWAGDVTGEVAGACRVPEACGERLLGEGEGECPRRHGGECLSCSGRWSVWRRSRGAGCRRGWGRGRRGVRVGQAARVGSGARRVRRDALVEGDDRGEQVRVAEEGRGAAVGLVGDEEAAELGRCVRAECAHRERGQFRVGEQTGRPAGQDLVDPGTPAVRVRVAVRVRARDPLPSRAEPPGPARESSAASIAVGYRSRAATVTACRACASHRAGGQRPAGRGEGTRQPLRGGRDDRGEYLFTAGRPTRRVRGTGRNVSRRPGRPDVTRDSFRAWPPPHPSGRPPRPPACPGEPGGHPAAMDVPAAP